MQEFPIQYLDYRRIFSTIYSILLNEDAELNHSCLYFSIFGALILNEHYNINAKAHAGLAAIKIGAGESDVLIFAEGKNGVVSSSETGFHSWIETEDWIIDFSAPQFPKLLKSMGQKQCKSKMFQKRISEMTPSPNDFEKIGEYCFHPDPELTNKLVDHFIAIQMNLDLINICNKWYRKPPHKMLKSIPISDGFGNMSKLSLQTIALSGTW